VDATYVVGDAEAQTAVALIQVAEDGKKQIAVAPGAKHRLTATDVQQAAAPIQAARLLLIQLEMPLASVVAAVQLGHAAGARVILDSAPPAALPDDLLQVVAMVKPNASEAEALTGVRVQDRAAARRAAQQLLGRGVGGRCCASR
jgi:ribokinase